MAIKFNIEHSNLEKKSFALLRTNPKLTSNVKLIVNSIGDMFLGAFKANKSLSKVKYQKFGINEKGSYSEDVAKFFKGIPINEKFETLRKNSDITPFSDYSFQYEDQYNYGASFNSTKLYDEQYKIFAPIWLDRQIPKKFVIYRVSGTDYSNSIAENYKGQNDRVLELLKNAKIIKTFDLTKDSKIGSYLNKHVYNKGVQESPISFNFGKDTNIEYRGIDVEKGGFANKKEFLAEDFIRKDNPEIYANDIISKGFERQGLISSNLINIEFLFDDQSADNYKIYRYFGIYVDPIEEGSFNIDTISKSGIISIEPNSFISNYDLNETSLTEEDMIPTPLDLAIPMLGYIKTSENNYSHIKNNINFNKLRIPTSLSQSDFQINGLTKLKNNVKVLDAKVSNKGFLKINITNTPNANDRIYLGDKTEIELADYSLFNFTCIASDQLSQGTISGNKFSNKGSLNQVALALGSLIKKQNLAYNVEVKGTSIIIEDYAAGDSRKRMSFGIYNQNLNTFIDVETSLKSDCGLLLATIPAQQSTDFNNWDLHTATGGSKIGACYLTKSSDLDKVSVGYFGKEIKLNKYSKIISIVKDPFNVDLHRVIFDKNITLSNDGTIQLYEKNRPSLGKFSAYDLKDFDFDFYSTLNSDLGELEYEESLSDYDVEFNNLNPVLQQVNIDENIENEKIYSEYDRLAENSLKEFSLTSRVVPNIMKFVLKNGTNSRNLPYFLNASEVFGQDNISCNIEIETGINVDNLNMEHFHFNQMPDHIYDTNMLNLSSYTDFDGTGGISMEQLESTDTDYFSLYFKRSGGIKKTANSDIWLDDNYRDLFTKFGGASGELDASTIFRGLRYVYKKRKELSKASPTEFIKTPEVNDYRFGVILNYESNVDIKSNNTEYKVIKNDVFKFICVVLNLYVVKNDVKNLSRSSVYSIEDIYLENKLVNTQIPFDIDLSLSDFTASDLAGISVYASEYTQLEGSSSFLSSITKDGLGNYSWVYFEVDGEIYAMKVLSVVDNNEIKVYGPPVKFNINTGIADYSSSLPAAQISQVPVDTQFNYWGTGQSGWINIFEEIVSYNFASRFNKFGDIQYKTITEDGEFENDFVLEIEDGVEIIKPSVLQTKPESEKPKAYQLVTTQIGKILAAREDGGYLTTLRRFNGNYTPLFKSCVSFTDILNEQGTLIPVVGEDTIDPTDSRSLLIHNKFKYTGVAFNSFKLVDFSYGFIKNMFYHKVNDEDSKNLLKLSATSDKLPLYPILGEIAIDKKDFNVFESKYSKGYFTKSLSGLASEKVAGTLTPIELKSFMVSTIMKVKDNYDLTSFTQNEESSIDSLDYIRFNQLNKKAIHWFEEEDTITADFYLPKSIFNELLEDGIFNEFKKYVDAENSFGDKSTVKDDLEIYVYKNIVNRFILENIEIYGKEAKNISTSLISINDPSDLAKGGFIPLTNFEIRGYQNDGLSFRLIYNKRKGYKYSLKFHIKIQA